MARNHSFHAVTARWRQPDIVSIAYVASRRDAETQSRLRRLAALLGGRLLRFGTAHGAIRGRDVFIRLARIPLSAAGVGAAAIRVQGPPERHAPHFVEGRAAPYLLVARGVGAPRRVRQPVEPVGPHEIRDVARGRTWPGQSCKGKHEIHGLFAFVSPMVPVPGEKVNVELMA